jgi:alkaline phosphatase
MFDDAVGAALKNIGTKDTLVTVTADHSHVFTMGGYPGRGNPIMGIAKADNPDLTQNNVTYTSLQYGNGPGFYRLNGVRTTNLTEDQTTRNDYQQESAVPLGYETHGGEGKTQVLM